MVERGQNTADNWIVFLKKKLQYTSPHSNYNPTFQTLFNKSFFFTAVQIWLYQTPHNSEGWKQTNTTILAYKHIHKAYISDSMWKPDPGVNYIPTTHCEYTNFSEIFTRNTLLAFSDLPNGHFRSLRTTYIRYDLQSWGWRFSKSNANLLISKKKI